MKAKQLQSGEIVIGLPSIYSGTTGVYPGGFHLQPDSIHEAEGFYRIEDPIYDSTTHKIDGIHWDETNSVFKYNIVNKSEGELSSEFEEIATNLDNSLDITVVKKFIKEQILSSSSEEGLLGYTSIFPAWKPGLQVYDLASSPTGKPDILQFDGLLYKVVQSHTTQITWLPTTATSLFSRIAAPGTIGEWIQPTGAHDDYDKGEKVRWKSKTWENTIDANVWEPGVHGWVEIT